jgi:hypothetical protein
MMNNNKKTGKEKSPQPPEGFEKPLTHIPKEILHNLLRIAAECELDRWMKESVNGQMNNEGPYIPSANNVKFSAQTFIAVLQAVGNLRRGMSLDIIAQHNAFNHEPKELLNKIATILGRTYIELGDGAEFADDEALLMIRDLLLAFDSTIIHRTRFRKITSEYKSGYNFGNSK